MTKRLNQRRKRKEEKTYNALSKDRAITRVKTEPSVSAYLVSITPAVTTH